MEAMAQVPRDAFVPAAEKPLAWLNRPLPIGQGQTISQPFVVALMTDLLDLEPDDTVLEIGTGCGYQCAVLAHLAAHVYSVERLPEFAAGARRTLADLGVANVDVRTGDGHLGWPEHAPYKKIMVTAAAEDVPPALVEQLAPGGRMVVPVGRGGWLWGQELTLVTKDAAGDVTESPILGVAFVPLVHDEA